MGISFKRFDKNSWILWDSINCNTLNPLYMHITKEEIEGYLKENPMPKDKNYSKEDMINDLTGSSGAYVLPTGTKKETAEFISEMIYKLL